jgi:streptogramin lyase
MSTAAALVLALAPATLALAATITEFPLATGGFPTGITTGPDGNIWFTGGRLNQSQIGRMSTSGSVTMFPLPNAASYPVRIVTGPDGNLWFTEIGGVGRITTAGVVTEFAIPSQIGSPNQIATDGIVVGPDGNLWVTETNGKIAKVTTSGAITEFAIPTPNSQPHGIAAGPDGALWFTELVVNKIGRITTLGAITEFSGLTSPGGPFDIASGPDGNLWFTEYAGGRIGRMTTSGTVAEFAVPGSSAGNIGPYGIAVGPDGQLWFTELGSPNKVGSVTTNGIITEFAVPTANADPTLIAVGPDGSMWFTEHSADKIGRIQLAPRDGGPPTAPTAPTAPGMCSQYLAESSFVFVRPGQSAQFAVAFTNCGSTSWTKGTSAQVNLAVCCPLNSASPNAAWNTSWLSPAAYATTTASAVAPGQQGLFTYAVTAPANAPPGDYVFAGEVVQAATGAALNPQGYYQIATILPSICGTVTSATSGLPVANVIVRASSAAGGATADVTTTDGAGKYCLVVPTGVYDVSFRPDASTGLAPQIYNGKISTVNATSITVSGANVTGIDAALGTAYVISGTLTNKATGTPMPTVVVNAYEGSTAGNCCYFVNSAVTNASGAYSLSVGNGLYRISFAPPPPSGLGVQWWSSVGTVPSWGQAEDILVNGANVSGRNAALQ